MPSTLLVCEPSDRSRRRLEEALAAAGNHVRAVGDAAEALSVVREKVFEAIVAGPSLRPEDVAALSDAVDGGAVVAVAGTPTFAEARALTAAGARDLVAADASPAEIAESVARTVDAERRRASRSLLGVSRAIFATADRAQLPRLIVEEAMEVMDADHVSLMLLGPDERLYVAHAHGLPAEVQRQTRLAIGERIAGRAAAERVPIVLDGRAADDGRFCGVDAHRRLHACIVYPLVSGDAVHGVLNISRARHARPFGPADLSRAAVLASQVVLALENVTLIRELCAAERLAAADELAAGVLHEVNNPLCFLLMNLDEIEERVAELAAGEGAAEGLEMLAEAVAEARRGAARIREITADMRTLVQVDHEQRDVIDVAGALAAAVALCGGPEPAGLPAGMLVRASRSMLERVFTSVLCHLGEACAGARVSAEAGRGRVVVRLSGEAPDPGEEGRRAIFDPFGQPAGRGRALSLWLVRELVCRHGGAVEALGEGGRLVFEVTLPLAQRRAIPAGSCRAA